MDARALHASSAAFEAAQQDARAKITLQRPEATHGSTGAYSNADTRAGQKVSPFYEDRVLTLSRPAHLRDYQADSAAYPFRAQGPDELAPWVPKPQPIPEMPRMVFTSEAEQQWLQERDAAMRQAEAAQQDAPKDFSQAPPPFVSRLGFRQAAPMPPQPPAIKTFCHEDGVSKEFFSSGSGRFVSENGRENAQRYYLLARPLGGRAKSHKTSETTPFGYMFDQYTRY